MATILKCKMCGGNIEIQEGSTVAKCRYCGSMMTLPKIDSDKKARLFNRANEYRLNNEFDKAYEAYKAISLEDTEEAEAYWGMLLAEYGIEYVEDPKTGERVPTCHRTQIQSIKASSNYKLACQHADLERRMMYEDEADAIDKIQKGIISVSTKEKPYDAFICYKETDDATGERTHDSVLAQDIYNELNKLGIRTFFSRITLEDKLGVDYEPYIYAALRSAKVMLVVTTSSEHCDAVWVKNEWMRFLRFMEDDSSKVIIPVYKEMSAYELPVELSKYQAQDMSKIGAVQDLAHGVQRIVGTVEKDAREEAMEALVREKLAKDEEIRRQKEEEKRKEEERKATEEEKKKKQEAFWKKNKKFVYAGIVLMILAGIGAGIYKTVISPLQKYNQAISDMENHDYDNAIAAFEELGDYKDCKIKIYETELHRGHFLLDEGDYDTVIERFTKFHPVNIDEAEDERLTEEGESIYREAIYLKASQEFNEGNYQDAAHYYSMLQIYDYKDSRERRYESLYQFGKTILDNEQKNDYQLFIRISKPLLEAEYKDSAELINEAKYRQCVRYAGAVHAETDGYYDDLYEIGYKDIQHYKTIHDTRVSIVGTWKENSSSAYNTTLTVEDTQWGLNNWAHNNYSFDEDTLTFTFMEDRDKYTVRVVGNALQIMNGVFAGTYYRQ